MLADGKTAAISVYGKTGSPGRQVVLIDAATGKTLSTVDLGESSRPHGLDALKDGRLLVTAEGTRELAIVDPKTAKVVKRISTNRDVSHMVASSPDGKRAWVSSIAGGSVTVIDLGEGKIVTDIPTGKGAEGVAVTPDGREVWVANRGANTLSVIDATSLKVVATIEAGEFPIRVKLHAGRPEGDRRVHRIRRRRRLRPRQADPDQAHPARPQRRGGNRVARLPEEIRLEPGARRDPDLAGRKATRGSPRRTRTSCR